MYTSTCAPLRQPSLLRAFRSPLPRRGYPIMVSDWGAGMHYDGWTGDRHPEPDPEPRSAPISNLETVGAGGSNPRVATKLGLEKPVHSPKGLGLFYQNETSKTDRSDGGPSIPPD